jgi:hypothetical protein
MGHFQPPVDTLHADLITDVDGSILYKTPGHATGSSRRLIIPGFVLDLLRSRGHPSVDPIRFGELGFQEFRGHARVIARILRSRPNFFAQALALVESGTPLPEIAEDLDAPPADAPRTGGGGLDPIQEEGAPPTPAGASPADPAPEERAPPAAEETFSPTEEGDTDLLTPEEEEEARQAEKIARERAAEEAALLSYLRAAPDPREAAKRVLYLVRDRGADLRSLVRVAARERVQVTFYPSGTTAQADAGYHKDLRYGATEDEAFERHRSRLRSWQSAIRRGEEVRAADNARKPGTTPTLNGATGDYKRRLLWEWQVLQESGFTILEEEWRKAASLAHLLDMVKCRREGTPLVRREVPASSTRRR